MSRYAIFSDVHGNYEALEAFIEHSARQGVEYFLCCGDIVGYGADPAACLEKVLHLCQIPGRVEPAITLGNHDEAVVLREIHRLNPYASRVIHWTRKQLSSQQIAALGAFPLTWELDNEILLVHSSPNGPAEWDYIFDLVDVHLALEHFTHALCCVGHTHVPIFIECRSGKDPVVLHGDQYGMHPDSRYLVNVGSIGQPRDSDPRGCYLLYDSEHQTLQRHRFSYNVRKAQEKILRAGLPPILAQRLEIGF